MKIWVKEFIDEKIDGSSGTTVALYTHRVGGGNANKARGINLHSYTKNDCQARCRSLLLFGKSIKELSPNAGKLSTFSILNAESFHLRWIDIHLGHSAGGPRLLLSPFHLKLLNYSPLILPELCTAEAPLAVLILVRKDRLLYTTFTYVWIIKLMLNEWIDSIYKIFYFWEKCGFHDHWIDAAGLIILIAIAADLCRARWCE